jgi:hypothetical protein
MKIGFDLHGVLDTYPEKFKPMIEMLRLTGHQVCIVSGPTKKEIYDELYKIGINPNSILVHSVVDYLRMKGIEFTYDEKETPWCDEETWWDSKARMCKQYGIDYLIDDSLKYKPAFDLIDADFIHVSEFTNV